ncbi:MAG: hypothetical protein Kow0042_15700 [Calditrichia bacterium]
MKRFVLLILAIGLAITLFFCTQEQEKPAEEPVAVEVKTVQPFYYVGLKHVGPYEDHQMVIEKFLAEAEARGLKLSGPMFGIYLNNPQQVAPEQLEWIIAFEVEDTLAVSEPLMVGKWDKEKVLSHIFTGPYSETGKAYELLQNYAQANKLTLGGPAVERFLTAHPTGVPPESLKTEIWLPVVE